MKASKFIVLVGGVLGLLAFFLPLVDVQRGSFHGTVSAFEIVKGIDVSLAQLRTITLAIFAPALLLALIGGLGVTRRKFGRGAGTFALLFGLVGLGIAVLLQGAAEGDSGIGLKMLLGTGAAGVIGGVFALAKPERKPMPLAA